jgi:anaerobic selenocysteine-containing dehydrogenase
MPDRIHHRACNLCEAICGLRITVGECGITDIRGDDQDPLSRGHICPKAVALQDLYDDPDRLRRPLRREGVGWREVSWKEALDETAERLAAIRSAHGADAIGVYAGNPNVHNYGSLLYGPAFHRALGTRRRFSATSVDQLPHHVAARWMFGHMLLLPVPDLDRTSFLLVVGANPMASNGSLMTSPDVRTRLKAIGERGGRVVVIDPRRTETAKLAGHHHFIRPGTDGLLLAALLQVIFAEELADPGRLANFADGVEELALRVSPFPPERVAEATGIPAQEIRGLARDLAAAESATVYGRIGVSVQEFGTLCQMLINALNVVTGNLDRPGGPMFTTPAVDLVARTSGGKSGRWTSRVRGLPEFAGELPVATLAEEILTEGSGRIRALVTSAGNPVLSTPNGGQVDRALESLDFMVSVDFYLNETTRHAHLVLPPTSPLEHDHYDLVFHLLAVRNTARYSPPLFAPEPGMLHDWQIFAELERRLGKRSPRARLARWLRHRLGPRRLLDLALRTGPHGAGLLPRAEGLTLGRLEREPHGVDLGPLEPRLPVHLRTEDRRIHLVPPELVGELERLQRRLARREGEPRDRLGRQGERPSLDGSGREREGGGTREPGLAMLLIGRRQVRSNNSWMHNYDRLMKGKDRCTLLMHPEDAARLGLSPPPGGTGSSEPSFKGSSNGRPKAVVSSRVGRLEVPVDLTDEIMPGVVSLPHGWGHDRPGVRLQVASASPGISLNDLTDERRIDPASGNAALTGLPVWVAPVQ